MSIWKTYFDKNNTILKNSVVNTARNPIAELSYGSTISRFIFYVDFNELSNIYDENRISINSESIHKLKIKNTANFDINNLLDINNNIILGDAKSPSNFTLELHKITIPWAEGYGYAYNKGDAIDNMYSEEPSNWFNATTLTGWTYDGVVSGSTQLIAQSTFLNPQDDIEFDISSFVNQVLSGNTNNYYGFVLKYSDSTENLSLSDKYSIGLYTRFTNTYFQPHIESYIPDQIKDDRFDAYVDDTIRLYMYSIINGQYENLDELPICNFNDNEYTVHQTSKGVYYIEVDTADLTSYYEYEDVWSNLIYNTRPLSNKTFKTVLKDQNEKYKITNYTPVNNRYVSIISGINKGQQIKNGNLLLLGIFLRRQFDHINVTNITNGKLEYMLYVKQGENKILFNDWLECDKLNNRFQIKLDSRCFVSQKYYLDLRYTINGETHILEEQTNFEIL